MVTDRCSNGSRTPHRRGFTLIEILVVVAIIALLISILLPSLSKARDQAKAVACSSNLRQIGTGEATYQSQSKEWIPGSPLTTGISWVMTHTSSVSQWNPITSGFNRLSLGLYDYATPIRAALFGSKSIPSGAASGDWASANKAIWLQATTGMFACPSNPERYGPYNASGWPIIQASSYLTSSNLMRGGPDLYDKVGPTGNGQYYAQGSTWEVAAPNGYRPRHSRLARESMKVFMADGYRYFDNATGDKDYDPNPSGLFS